MLHSRRFGNLVFRQIAASRARTAVRRPIPTYHLIATRNFSEGLPEGSNIPDKVVSAAQTVQNVVDEKVLDAAVAVTNTEAPGYVAGKVMESIDLLHSYFGIPYWEAIVAATVVTRIFLLPIAIKTVQGAARMAAMRPEMQRIQDAMNSDPNAGDMHVKQRYATEMRTMFAKYKVNPFLSIIWPFFQLPVFISFFFALQDMGKYYPDLATGGALWFENLAIADPYLALPVINAISFLVMIELGQEGVQMEQKKTFNNVMRVLGVAMVPLLMHMPQGLFVYWGTNNALSIAQTLVLKNSKVREILDIPKPPAPENTPALKVKSPIQSIKEMIAAEKSRDANAKAEVIDGVKIPKPPAGPPPATFAAPPKRTKIVDAKKPEDQK